MDTMTKIGDAIVAMSNWLWGPPLLILFGMRGIVPDHTVRIPAVQIYRIYFFTDLWQDV